MKVRVDNIPKDGLRFSFSGQEDVLSQIMEKFPAVSGVKIDPLIQGDIQLLQTTDGIVLNGSIRTTLNLQCSRCLATFDIDKDLDLNFLVRQVDFDGTTDKDAWDSQDSEIVVGSEIDLGEIIVQELLLEVPMKPLCREDCQGLCPRCGALRGSDDCDCPLEVSADPRWEQLTNLVKK
ncbi:MAG: DUF177 domain-containing protein [Desulfomonile sp.]|nr:DUF177 domain-containing protein [Deltaproteobacteria bacterium]